MHQRHGLTKHAIYTTWRAMRSRCLNPKNDHWPDYGGRGIAICSEWSSFPVFYAWAIGSGWCAGLTIDRRRVAGNYEPGNCRWATPLEQAETKRPIVEAKNAVVVEYAGRRAHLSQWSRETGIGYTTLLKRLAAGKTGAALFAPVVQHKSHKLKRASASSGDTGR